MLAHYLIVSDLHLCDFEDHADGWMAHKHPRHSFDDDFAALLARFEAGDCCGDASARFRDQAEARDGAAGGIPEATQRRTLILNGDILDFDLISATPAQAPWPVSRSERRRGLASTAAKSAWKARAILEAHPRFVAALAGFLERGHEVVYVLGNHDREFHYPEVRQVLCEAIAAQLPLGSEALARLTFEPWFFYVPGQLYVEHGQQYSYYTSFLDPLNPTIDSPSGPVLALPMGNLSNRYLITQMGFFNPFASDFILNIFAYLWHWLRYYAFSRHSLALAWFWGSIVVMFKLLGIKRRQLGQQPDPQRLRAVAEAKGLELARLEQLMALQQPPITDRFFRIVREFWIDRLLLSLGMIGGTVALALVPIPLWIKLMVPLTCFPIVFFLYEKLAKGETIFAIEEAIPKVAAAIASVLPTRVVAMGHDHTPRLLPLAREVTFVDSGTWAPIFTDETAGQLAGGFRNYVEASFDGEQLCRLELGSWLELG